MTQREIAELLSKQEPRIRKRFRAVMDRLKDKRTIAQLEQALTEGRIAEVLDDIEQAAGAVAAVAAEATHTAGRATAAYLSDEIDAVISYDTANPRAIDALRRRRAQLVGGITEDQRAAIVDVLAAGTLKGENPRKMALRIRDVLGLTRKQAARVQAYRDRLEQPPTPLNPDVPPDPDAPPPPPPKARPQDQVDRMVARFADRQLARRAETIARTEALSAVHEGLAQGFEQAIDDGFIEADAIEQKWLAGDPPRTREWHAVMDGQVRPWGEPFTSGHGVSLRYPGDPEAPVDERANCRCAIARRIMRKPKTEAAAA